MSSPSIARPLIAVIAVFLLALIAGGVALYMDGWRPAEMLTARSVEEPAPTVSGPGKSAEDNAVVETMPSDSVVAPGEAPAAADTAAGPVFDVVRVEPNGEALIAGRAAPDAEVEVLSNGEVVATAKADSSGAFVAMPEQPLDAGGHKLSLRVAGAPEAESAPAAEVAVVVPSADGSEGAEIAAAEAAPDDAASPAEEQQVASVAPTNPPVPAEEGAPAAPADSISGSGESEAPQGQALVAGQTEPSPGSADTVAAEPSSEPVEQNQTAEAGAEAPAGGPDSAGEGQESASGPAADQDVASAPVAESAGAGAGVDAAGSSPEPALPSADAPGTPGTEQEVASAVDVQSGEAAPSGSPAADATASANTAPAPDAPGSEQQVATVEPAPADNAGAAAGPTPFAVGEQPLSIEAVETEGQTLFVAGAAEPGTTVRVFADEELIGETQAGQGGNWLIETEKPITEPQVTMRAEEATESEVEVPEAVETDFVRLLDSDVLVPAAAPVAGAIQASAEAMPGPEVVIIRRGDTLWQLSRRNYGRGVRYDTIYSANRDQIQSPHWIYPGQVFVVPRSDRAWTETR